MSPNHPRQKRTTQWIKPLCWCVITLVLMGGCGSDNKIPDPCIVDADCAHLDDGNLCNGRARCGGFGQCTTDSKPVECPMGPCLSSLCTPTTGTCEETSAPNGTACAPVDACFVTAECQSGTCTGVTPSCNHDGNLCTETACQAGTGLCVTTPLANFAICDDDNLCTVNDRCLEGDCSGTQTPCAEDGDPCTIAACAPSTGQCVTTPQADGTACDDDDPCTSDDGCVGGTCTGGSSACAHLSGPCVAVTCDAETGECEVTNLNDDTPCDDNNPCTIQERCADGICTGGDSSCEVSDDPCTTILCDANTGDCISSPTEGLVPCDDADLCTQSDVCLNGFCVGGPVECKDDGNPCTAEGCVSTSGCISIGLDDAVGCDDQNPCTKTSTCQSGVCSPTAVTCPPTGNPCSVATCKATTGECEYKPLGNGAPCDDGNICSAGDACQGFICVPGEPVVCWDDNNTCTEETCEPTSGCVTTPAQDGIVCDDDNACTSGTSCDDGVCSKGQTVSCDLVTEACLVSVCDPNFGCTLSTADNGSPCDDDSACTTNDACQNGTCAGQNIDCPPSDNPCVAVTCDSELGCVTNQLPNNTDCNDQNACTTNTHCINGTCVAEITIECPPSTLPCRVATCSPGTGGCILIPVANETSCDDSDPCTVNTTCTAGACVGGLIPPCPSDDDPCTSKVCIPGTGCLYPVLTDGTTCNDGSACTTLDTCQDGLCVGVDPVACAPLTNPCFVSACNPSTGSCDVLEAPEDKPCHDGNLCTVTDGCTKGVCTGVDVVCTQDDNPCTVSNCVDITGFCATSATEAGSPCNDSNPCSEQDHCDDSGLCEGTISTCPTPEAPCQVALCDGSTGECVVSNSPNGSPCIDDNPCTSDDFCAAGVCVTGTSPACQTSNPCMAPLCEPTAGDCSEVPLNDGLPCNDNDACTSDGLCVGGLCVPKETIQCPNDNNPCTDQTCNPITGLCETVPIAAPIPCDDDNACTIGDHCENGLCSPNQEVLCPPSDDGCLVGICIPASGGCDWVQASDGIGCTDDNACTSNEACLAGDCVGETVVCVSPPNSCAVAFCNAALGCTTKNADDGILCQNMPCLVGSTCASGVCTGGTPTPCPEPANPCHEAICSAEEGCTTTALEDETPCDDDNLCTVDTTCQDGQCTGTSILCADDGPCLIGTCVNGVGCITIAAEDGTFCTDDDLCTLNDACISGVCITTSPDPCAGGTECQPETCDPQTGQCSLNTLAAGTACDDGNPCTDSSICTDGACLAESLVPCPQPESDCLLSACLPETGQCEVFPAVNGLACDDGSLCTEADHCIEGVCMGGASVACSNPVGCLLSTCDPTTGTCEVAQAPDGSPCDAEQPCSVGGTCLQNVCEGAAPNLACCLSDADCDDGTPCSQDTCTAGRCTHSLVDLPACIGRVLVAGAADGEVLILDAKTLKPAPGSPFSAGGNLRQIAVSSASQLAYIAADDIPNAWTFDPFEPTAAVPMLSPSTGPTRWTTVDDKRQIAVFVSNNGVVQTYDTNTGNQLHTGVSITSVIQRPLIDPEMGWLIAPSSLGTLFIVDVLAPQTLLPSTPWSYPGNLVSAVMDPSTRRLFVAAHDTDAVRVINVANGATLATDPLSAPATPSGLAINTSDNHLLVTYPDALLVRALALDNLKGPIAAAVALPGQPDVIHHDEWSNLAFVLGANANLLHILEGSTLTAHPQSPATTLQASVDVITIWTQPGPIVITEVFIGASGITPWIELHNPDSSTLTLANWALETESVTVPVASTTPLDVPSGGYVVVCGNDNFSTNGGVECDVGLTGLSITGASPMVILRDSTSQIIDHAVLPDSIPSNQSMALIHPGYHNGRPTHWAASNGSPGSENMDVAP